MFLVYILISQTTGKYYIGYTSDIDRRLAEHNRNNTNSLRNRGPFKVIYTEKFLSKEEAMFRERQIKSYHGGAAFKKLIAHV
jgi:putative endonuclease